MVMIPTLMNEVVFWRGLVLRRQILHRLRQTWSRTALSWGHSRASAENFVRYGRGPMLCSSEFLTKLRQTYFETKSKEQLSFSSSIFVFAGLLKPIIVLIYCQLSVPVFRQQSATANWVNNPEKFLEANIIILRVGKGNFQQWMTARESVLFVMSLAVPMQCYWISCERSILMFLQINHLQLLFSEEVPKDQVQPKRA